MSQTERIQIITGTDAPQSTTHLGRYGGLIAMVPFPSPNPNHSTSPYARPSDFDDERDLRHYLASIRHSALKDDCINIPNHFIRFFSYVEFYQKVFTGEISATKPSEQTPTNAPTVSLQDQITAIRYEAVPIDPFLIVQCILR